MAKGDDAGELVLYHKQALNPAVGLWGRPTENFLSAAGKGEDPTGPRFARLVEEDEVPKPTAESKAAGK